jgi:DNA-binding MarR family transcriptional regulator
MTKPGKTDALNHRQLVVEVGNAIRKMGAQSVIMSRTVADHFGLHMTDLEVLDLIFLRKQVSAGDLADATGLSSGAVTALIDRLAVAGYIERTADPKDRRRVIVKVRPEAIEPIKAVYMSTQKRMFDLWSTFTERDLEVIADFITRSTGLGAECCRDIRLNAPATKVAKRRAPRMSARTAVTATQSPSSGRRKPSR